MSRALVARPELSDLATLLAMADTDEIARLRLLRALRDQLLRVLVSEREDRYFTEVGAALEGSRETSVKRPSPLSTPRIASDT